MSMLAAPALHAPQSVLAKQPQPTHTQSTDLDIDSQD